MAFAAACFQKDNPIDEMKAQMILERKMNKAKEELLKLQQSYDTAVDDIQKHFHNASAALTTFKEGAMKALDAYMMEHQKRLREDLQNMKELQKSLSSAFNSKMDMGVFGEDDSMGVTKNLDQALSSIFEMHVETVPSIRFLGNEAFLFQVLNGNYLPYFGCIAVDNTLLATDLHLSSCMDSNGPCYTFRIDVPKRALDIEELKTKIKCEVFQKDRGASVSLTPIWVTDHFEIKFGFSKKTEFSLGVYLLEQHIAGSPTNVNLENDLLHIDDSGIKDMDVVKTSAKRSLGISDPLVEAALLEVNNNVEYNNNNNNTSALETDLLISGRTCKISKKTKLPCSPITYRSLKPLCEVPRASLKKRVTGRQESGASCSSHVSQGRSVTQTQEKQGVQSVTKYEKRPFPTPIPPLEEEHCSSPVHKVDQEHSPDSVAQVQEQHESGKKEQSSPIFSVQPVLTTTDWFGKHENSSRKICFPNKYIRHTFHPGVCRPYFESHQGSSENEFPRILTRLAKASWRKSSYSENNEDVVVEDLEIICTKEDAYLSKEGLVKQECLIGSVPENLMIKTVSFNAIEANLSSTTSIEEPFALNRPVGILEHSSGDIIVSDTFNDRVLRLNKNGGPMGLAGPSMGFRRPSSVVELHDGSFAVICSNFIAVFDAEGNYMKILGKNLLQKPYGLSLSEDGKLLTVETVYLGCLVIVTICPDLEFELSRIRVPLQLPANQEGLSKPRFMASYKDKIYVGDLGLNCIYEVNYTTGCLLNVFGRTGTDPGCLNDPSGIACDPDGNIFVADSRNHRIQVFDSFKKFICIIDVDYPLNRPSGIYLTRNDHLFVLNYWDNTLAKYQLTYKFI